MYDELVSLNFLQVLEPSVMMVSVTKGSPGACKIELATETDDFSSVL